MKKIPKKGPYRSHYMEAGQAVSKTVFITFYVLRFMYVDSIFILVVDPINVMGEVLY